jgi:glycosyltransferase involved in cell wall biosynthesis
MGDNGSVHIQKWIKGINERSQIRVSVITFNRGFRIEGVSYFYLKKWTGTKLDYLLNLFRMKSIIRSIQPDILHSHYATSYGFMGACSGFHPYIITGWGADIFDSPRNFFMRHILRYSFRKADAITVLSGITRKEMLKLTGKEVSLIPFGVDLTRFHPMKKSQDGLVRIGTIRTLSEKYGVEYLIRAFALLCKKHEQIRLEIVGDGPLRNSLKTLSEELHIEDKVIFHGYVNQMTEWVKYISILTSFDIFAILSVIESETFGVAAVEASACEIPVVATSVGGLPEVVESDQTGIIVPLRDTETTAKALDFLISNAAVRLQMGKNGRRKAEQQYNWNNNLNQMIQLYENLLKIDFSS